MDFVGGKNNIAAYRLEHANQIRQFKTELLHLLQKAARTWYGQPIDVEKAEDTLVAFGQNIASPRTFLLLGVDGDFKACGYIFGIAKPEVHGFALHSFYAREEVMQETFTEMFDALDRYCYKAEITRLEFRIVAELPYSNPRMQAFLRRFQPTTVLVCNLDKQNADAFTIQPEETQAPSAAAQGDGGHVAAGDTAA